MRIGGNSAFFEGEGEPCAPSRTYFELQSGPLGVSEPAAAGPHAASPKLDPAPRSAFGHWLEANPGGRPCDFAPMIREAEFAYRCRSAFVPAGDSLGGVTVMERRLGQLELGLCCGWRVLDRTEARSLSDWLDAVLPHHPWAAAIDWRQSEAQAALADYCREDEPEARDGAELRSLMRKAGLAALFDQAVSFRGWRDVEALVLAAWMGGAMLVDARGHLVVGWRLQFARSIVTRLRRSPC